ncbi:hypothetical protein [Microbacterium excoecariae]|uniref:hypothetical protein n=1 Tax=Microbacterium excoecariae TaxID=2715210 RepID=UPI00140DA516|nr:hypothetical protein [Microbacterium excoecariae]NHI16862.1 hypothetical protein [Microbacterium excoecariae]
MKWPAFFSPHTVRVRDIASSGGMGTTYTAPRELAAEVKDEQTLVRDRDAREVVSSTQVTVALDARVTPGALVTVWPGEGAGVEREATVITVARHVERPPLESHLVLFLE